MRALFDAGGDVHGFGDVHQLDVIGRATSYHEPGRAPGDNPAVISLLLERGARHHIFSAISVGDLDLIRKVVEDSPEALDRRMSRFEQGHSPLHFAISRNRYDILGLLIELGADLEAEDNHGHTALETAMLRGDQAAMSRLLAAGASIRSRLVHVDRLQRSRAIRRQRPGELGNGVLRKSRTHAEYARKTGPARRELMVLYRPDRPPLPAPQVPAA